MRKINYREKKNVNLVKHRRWKRRVNIFTSVIDIPFHGNIFSACFWRIYIGKKWEGGGHRKQQLGIGNCLNLPTR